MISKETVRSNLHLRFPLTAHPFVIYWLFGYVLDCTCISSVQETIEPTYLYEMLCNHEDLHDAVLRRRLHRAFHEIGLRPWIPIL